MRFISRGNAPEHFEQAIQYCQRFVQHQNWSELHRTFSPCSNEALRNLNSAGIKFAVFWELEYSRRPFSDHWVVNLLMLQADIMKVMDVLLTAEWVYQPNRSVYRQWVWEFTKGENMIRVWRGVPGVRNKSQVLGSTETGSQGWPVLSPDVAVAALCAEYCFSGHADDPVSLMAAGVAVWHVDDWVRLTIRSYELGLCRSVYVLGNHARRWLGVEVPQHLLVTMRFLPTPIVTRAIYEIGRKRLLSPLAEWLCDRLSWSG